jgi:hypothetical protein
MAKSIQFTVEEWAQLRLKMAKDHELKPSIFMIREVMKRELGFTTRMHRQWDPGMVNYQEHVLLDFWNDEKETFFRLKYL